MPIVEDVDGEIQPSALDEISPVVPEGQSQTAPDGMVSATSQTRPIEEPTGSVLQLGVSPWMRSITTQGATGATLEPPYDREAQLVSVGNTASLFREIQTVQDKEYKSAQRKRAVEETKEEEHKLERWEEENLGRCKLYFYLGCLGLPILHLINVIYFLKELRGHDRDFKIKKYIYMSLLVGMIQTFIWILWIVVFQLLRETSLKGFNILNTNYTVGTFV